MSFAKCKYISWIELKTFKRLPKHRLLDTTPFSHSATICCSRQLYGSVRKNRIPTVDCSGTFFHLQG
jgi:hypothetical protein